MKKYVILYFAMSICSLDITSASLSTTAEEELFKGCETDEQKVERVITKASEGDYPAVADGIPQVFGQMKQVSENMNEALTNLANSRRQRPEDITEEGRKYYHDYNSKNHTKGILNDPEHLHQTSRKVHFTKETEANDNNSTSPEGEEAALDNRDDDIMNGFPTLTEISLDDIPEVQI